MWLLLGLASGLCWGVGDFIGGLQSRRLPLLAVAFWSQVAGALLLAVVLLVLREPPVAGSVAWGLAAGLCGLVGLLCFYRGLAIGTMSLIAPLGACGALVPVLFGLARGDRPSFLAALGMVFAFAGILVISRHVAPETDATATPPENPRAAILLGLTAALGFGCFFILLNEGGQVAGGSAFWTVAGARVSSVAVLLVLLLGTTRGLSWPGRRLPLVALGGALDTLANLLFTVASTLGPLGIVSILGSLYPVATVLLGRIVLSERLSRTQWGGVALALAGVALVSAR